MKILPGEIFVIDGVGDLDSGDINLGGGGQQEPLVHPEHTIQLKMIRDSTIYGRCQGNSQGNSGYAVIDRGLAG